MRPHFGHGLEIHRGSAFHAWPQYGQSTMTSDGGDGSGMGTRRR